MKFPASEFAKLLKIFACFNNMSIVIDYVVVLENYVSENYDYDVDITVLREESLIFAMLTDDVIFTIINDVFSNLEELKLKGVSEMKFSVIKNRDFKTLLAGLKIIAEVLRSYENRAKRREKVK